MNVTLTSLEALILKATHESLISPDNAAMEAFCAVMRDSSDGSQLASQALAARIHSKNSREAMLTLSMLDWCMRKSGPAFHAEIGKFRFLNEMIKLVSPKYCANTTAPEVQTRVVQLLHAWSIEFPKESKFKVAYDMLRNQGVIKETPPPLPSDETQSMPRTRTKNAIFEDEEKSKLLQKLLQSKKPEDLQHANRLIKTMVREEERRNEASSRRAQEVSAALDSGELLRDMLEHASDASPDEEELIYELHASCLRLKPVLQRLAASEAHTECLDDILHASDVLDEAFEKYNLFLEQKKSKCPKVETGASNKNNLLDFAGANIAKGGGDTEKSDAVKKTNVIDELGDIFSASSIAEPLKPVNLMPNDESSISEEKTRKADCWNELDSLGEQLMKKSLPDHTKRIDNFNSKPAKKIPMNSLEKSPNHEGQSHNNGAILDLDFFTKKPEEQKCIAPQSPKQTNDDVMVDITSDLPDTTSQSLNNYISTVNQTDDNMLDLELTLETNAKCDKPDNLVERKDITNDSIIQAKESVKNSKVCEVKSLADINVTLQSVKPSKVPPMKIFQEDDGVTVVLHFCKDKPRPDVNVIVISTTSKNTSPIEDYKFQSIVPKGCKVRLLTASGTSLPAYNPFLPPPALTQVMLVARPTSLPLIDLKFVITYTCDDEMYSEMGEVKTLPLDDI